MVENLVSKASASLAMMYAVKNAGIDRDEVNTRSNVRGSAVT